MGTFSFFPKREKESRISSNSIFYWNEEILLKHSYKCLDPYIVLFLLLVCSWKLLRKTFIHNTKLYPVYAFPSIWESIPNVGNIFGIIFKILKELKSYIFMFSSKTNIQGPDPVNFTSQVIHQNANQSFQFCKTDSIRTYHSSN